MLDITNYTEEIFEKIKHIDKYGNEYWTARELMTALGYAKWQKFESVIDKAKDACINSDYNVSDQFTGAGKLSINVNGGKRIINDYKLAR